jgi:gliding motility-associated-like protein
MPFYKLIGLILFVFICNSAFPATFTVTSNADSGPGTLRQALLDAAANGTTQLDYINFNIPGNTGAGVTIIVQSQLPNVTANVIIDGTTEPGPFLGVSNAKVIITPATPTQHLDAFTVSNLVGPNDAVEFYGLYIKGFSVPTRGYGSAIITGANCKLVIGAPGKGNVICGNWYAIAGYLKNATIQSNFIGVDSDGETGFQNWSLLYANTDYDNLLIGGTAPGEGNVIEGGWDDGIDFGSGVSTGSNKTVMVQDNLFGTDYKGTSMIRTVYNAFILLNDPDSKLLVTGNVFSAAQVAISSATAATIIVKGNYFGTDKTQTIPLGSGYEAIHIVINVIATIGGDLPADQNIFTNYNNPIFADNDANMYIRKNSFYCNSYVSVGNLVSNSYIRITNLTNNSVSGDAAPGALVQLYYADAPNCPNCNPTTWFADVTADANGRWVYNGNTTQNILASATVNNNTFGFQRFLIYPSDVTIADYDCHHPGSITVNENRTGRIQFIWRDNATGKIVGTGRTINNLPAGVYNLEINEGGTCAMLADGQFTINDLTPHVYPSTFQLDCTHPTAFFTAFPSTAPGITVAKYYWEDSSGKLIGSKSDIQGLAAGDYYLYITDSNGCNSAKALFKVLPAIDTPVIDESKATITDAECDFPDGSVTGITFSNGAGANYGWSRANGTIFSFLKTDLKNAPPGQYYFFIDYDFNCPEIKSSTFTVGSKNGITMNESSEAATSSTCGNSNGAIKGIVVNGATTYQWFDSNNVLAGTNADLLNVPAGSYYLVASNAACSKQSAVYTVTNTPPVNNYQSTFVVSPASCGLSNGGVSVTFDGTSAPKSYRWTLADGTPLIVNSDITSQPAGTYQLYVTDVNGCESFYKSYTINSIPPIQIVAGSAQVTNDQCGQGLGSIKNIAATGGVPPYTYSWINAAQQGLGTSVDITGIRKGVYTLQVKDATACDVAAQDYTVLSDETAVPAPGVTNLQICSPGDALLRVTNPQAGYGYRLYDTNISTNFKDDEPTGVFKITVTNSESVFISQYLGDCESPRAEVKIMVGLSSLNIPNTFTPNGDGINDFWLINGIDNYPNALVQVFNRYGQKVFDSKGYDHPFDGKSGGSVLPAGVYYYIINLNSKCSLLSGSLTILR